jgi:hypothetical protein
MFLNEPKEKRYGLHGGCASLSTESPNRSRRLQQPVGGTAILAMVQKD